VPGKCARRKMVGNLTTEGVSGLEKDQQGPPDLRRGLVGLDGERRFLTESIPEVDGGSLTRNRLLQWSRRCGWSREEMCVRHFGKGHKRRGKKENVMPLRGYYAISEKRGEGGANEREQPWVGVVKATAGGEGLFRRLGLEERVGKLI